MNDITMPRLSESMTTGRLLRWLVKPGDTVREGDVVAEVETDKANMEIECLTAGTVAEILAEPGEDLPVGSTLAKVRPGSVDEPRHHGTPASPAPPIYAATPLAIRKAEELGVDLSTIRGTGPNGRILTEDVEAAADKRAKNTRVRTNPSIENSLIPDGYALRARVSAAPLMKALGDLKPFSFLSNHSIEHIAGIALVHSAMLAFSQTVRNLGDFEREIHELDLTFVTPRSMEFFVIPLTAGATMISTAAGMKPSGYHLPSKQSRFEATVAIGCGLESIERVRPSPIQLSISISNSLGEAESDIAISLMIAGTSQVLRGIEFLRDYSDRLREPNLLLSLP